MADTREDLQSLPVKLEPVPGDPQRFRITIELHADDLAQLIEPVLGLVKKRKTAERTKRRSRREQDQAYQARRARYLEIGRQVQDALERQGATGPDDREAMKHASRSLGMSVRTALDFLQLYRRQIKADREARALQLYARGSKPANIAKRLCVSRPWVYRTLAKAHEAGTMPAAAAARYSAARDARSGAGGGSRASSGDRAHRARREALDAPEAPSRSQQGSGREGSGNAAPSLPDPLPVGETRGCGGKAPTLRGATREEEAG